jgi:hypothetical protein
VKYCSDKCRALGLTSRDDAIEKAILKLLQARPDGATICLSEAVRVLQPGGADESRLVLMQAIRRAARRLAVRRQIVWLQGGRPVDPSKTRGPVRLRLTCSREILMTTHKLFETLEMGDFSRKTELDGVPADCLCL